MKYYIKDSNHEFPYISIYKNPTRLVGWTSLNLALYNIKIIDVLFSIKTAYYYSKNSKINNPYKYKNMKIIPYEEI